MGYISFDCIEATLRTHTGCDSCEDNYGDEVYVDVDVDIDDIFNDLDIDDIAEHLCDFDATDLKDLRNKIDFELKEQFCDVHDISTSIEIPVSCNISCARNLDDEYKIRALINNIDRFSVKDVEDFFNGKN